MSDFVDRVTVHVKGGDGGNGSAGIRREKYKPLAGPNGGNGGDGGSVIFMADQNANSLLDYRFMPHREAESGTMGLGDTKDGSKGADLILPGACYTEENGLFVNTEGRPQLALRANFAPGEGKENWAILRALSAVLGQALPAAQALQRGHTGMGEGDFTPVGRRGSQCLFWLLLHQGGAQAGLGQCDGQGQTGGAGADYQNVYIFSNG